MSIWFSGAVDEETGLDAEGWQVFKKDKAASGFAEQVGINL